MEDTSSLMYWCFWGQNLTGCHNVWLCLLFWSVLISSVVFSPGNWYSCTLNKENLKNTPFSVVLKFDNHFRLTNVSLIFKSSFRVVYSRVFHYLSRRIITKAFLYLVIHHVSSLLTHQWHKDDSRIFQKHNFIRYSFILIYFYTNLIILSLSWTPHSHDQQIL